MFSLIGPLNKYNPAKLYRVVFLQWFIRQRYLFSGLFITESIGRLKARLSSGNGLRSKRFVSWTSWIERYCRVRTVKPRLAATSVIWSPCYYGHFFWLPGKNRYIYIFLSKKTLVNTANFLFGPLLTALTGFHCSQRQKRGGRGEGKKRGSKKMRPWERNCRKVSSAIISLSNFEVSHYVTKIFNAVCWISWGCLPLVSL